MAARSRDRATENVTHPIVLLIAEESEAKPKLIIQLGKRKPTKRDRALNVTNDSAIVSHCNAIVIHCNIMLTRNNCMVSDRIGMVSDRIGMVIDRISIARATLALPFLHIVRKGLR